MDDQTGSFSRLWALIEWSFIGLAVIVTLIWVGFLNYISPSVAAIDRKSIKNKRVLIINGQSRLSKAIANVLRNCYNCRVIVLGKEEETKEEDSPTTNIVCDLSNNEEIRSLLKHIWDETNGIDLVINCEIDDYPNNLEIGHRVERIGLNIQLMINLLINLVPKMMIDKGNGKFVIIKNCRPPTHDDHMSQGGDTASEYDQLLDQLLSPSVAQSRSHIDLVQLYCSRTHDDHSELEETANRILRAIESGQRGIDINKNDFLANFIRKFTNTWRQQELSTETL